MNLEPKKELSVILPVYNGEMIFEKNFRSLHSYLNQNNWDFEIVAVNDGSTDGTLQKLNALQRQYDRVKVVSYEENRGKGYAIKQGSHFLEKSNVVLMDSDLPSTIDLSHLDTLFEKVNTCDVVVASRFHLKAQMKRKWHRQFVSFCHRHIVRIFFPTLMTTDPNVGFKVFTKSCLQKIVPFTNLNHWSWDLQALVCSQDQGYRIEEIPFNWIEEYETTSVRLLKDSISEFSGIWYIKYQQLRGHFQKTKRQEHATSRP